MGTYIYNPLKAPQIIGTLKIAPHSTKALEDRELQIVRESGAQIIIEGQPGFVSPWVVNIPSKTPDQIV